MKAEEKKNILYRRQFVLSPQEIPDLQHWRIVGVTKNYVLHIHPDLLYTIKKQGKKQLILLGDLFDVRSIEKVNDEIMNDLINVHSITELVNAVYTLAGRYALLFIENESVFLFNDPSASRKIYYTNSLKLNWCASEPHVIAKYCGIEKTNDADVLDYYNSPEFTRGLQINIGNNTIYDNIRQLMPNHYLELKSGNHSRFWPNKPLGRISLKEGTEKASEVITNIIESFSKRYKLMMTITGGNDTRILLAASRNVVKDIYLYINKHSHMDDDHQDIVTAKSLITKLGFQFHIHDYSKKADKDFEEVYRKNNPFPLMDNIGLIYNTYYKDFQDRVNLPGTFSDISRNFFFTYKKKLTPELLSMIYMKAIHHYIVDQKYFIKNFRKWMEEIEIIAKTNGYNILDLFNWEERNGNWYTKFQEDKDIAQEEFSAFNSRLFMDICLGVKAKYRDEDTNVLYKSMVKHMWPEALSEPMHYKSWGRYYLKKVGLYILARRLMKKY